MIIKVTRWMDNNEFEEMLKIADYVGRTGNSALFRLNMAKIRRLGYAPRDVLQTLRDLGVEEIDEVRKWLEESYTVELKFDGSEVLMIPRTYLGKLLEEIRGYVKYDSRRKVFVVKPMHFFKLKDTLSFLGVRVLDYTGISNDKKLPYEFKLKLELRPYQREAVKAWLDNKGKGIIALPTGAGKTIVALAAIEALNQYTLVVTYTKEQMFQWKEMIEKYTTWPSEMIGLYYGEEKKLKPITIATYQTAYRHIHKISPLFTMIVIDEVHHLPAEKFKLIAENSFACYRLGLSATVVREDGKHVELFPLMGGIVYSKTPYELASEGYLASYTIHQVYVELTSDEKKVFKEYLNAYRKLAEGRTFTEILELAKRGDERAQLALKAYTNAKQVVHKAKAKIDAVKAIVEKELKKGSKILVFTQYVDQAEALGKILSCPVITGEVDTKTRRRILEAFKEAEKGVLVLTTVGDEGLDIPDVNVGIIVTGTGSRRQFIQRLGRLLRPKPGKHARLYEIIVKGTPEEGEAKRRKMIQQQTLL